MSAYKKYVELQFKDRESLITALQAFGFAELETGKRLPLFGYHGDRRAESADIVIRREFISPGSNDVGFAWDAQKRAYVAIISDYDRVKFFPEHRMVKLKKYYAEAVVRKIAKRKRARIISDTTRENGDRVLRLRVRR